MRSRITPQTASRIMGKAILERPRSRSRKMMEISPMENLLMRYSRYVGRSKIADHAPNRFQNNGEGDLGAPQVAVPENDGDFPDGKPLDAVQPIRGALQDRRSRPKPLPE